MKEYKLRASESRLRYHDFPGNGRPLVFVHGLGCASSYDYPQVAARSPLAEHRRILVDLLGSGYSDKPEDFPYTIAAQAEALAELIAGTGLNDCILYAHSMGGAVAVETARTLGSDAAGLIISEGNLDAGGGAASRKIAGYDEPEYIASGHTRIIRASSQGVNRPWSVGLAMSAPWAVHRESVSLVEGGSPPWRENLYGLAVPKVFLFGEHSLPDPDFEELPRNGVPTRIVDGVGHAMAWENPEALSRAIADAVAGFEKSSRT